MIGHEDSAGFDIPWRRQGGAKIERKGVSSGTRGDTMRRVLILYIEIALIFRQLPQGGAVMYEIQGFERPALMRRLGGAEKQKLNVGSDRRLITVNKECLV